MKQTIDINEPPTVFCDSQADNECERQGWALIQKENYFIVTDKLEFILGSGNNKIDAVNTAMRKTSGKAYIPPWERRREWQHMQKSYKK